MKLAPQLIEFSKILVDLYAVNPIVNTMQQKMKQDLKQSQIH